MVLTLMISEVLTMVVTVVVILVTLSSCSSVTTSVTVLPPVLQCCVTTSVPCVTVSARRARRVEWGH